LSAYDVHDLACPGCATRYPVSILQGIHSARLPGVRPSILDGTFQAFPCPGCGSVNRVDTPSIYADFDRGHYLALEPASEGRSWRAKKGRHVKTFDACFTFGPPVAEDLASAMRHRLVFGPAALREKVVLWDAGLDDRVVEALKGDLLGRRRVPMSQELLRVSTIIEGGHLLFTRLAPPADASKPATLLGHETATGRAYERRLLDSSRIPQDYPWLSDDWLIDVHVAAPPGGP
jgi:hypothetical protein